MSKRTKRLAAAAAILLLIFTLSTTVMSVVMLVNQKNVNKMIAIYTGQLEDPEQEDDVVIAQNYTIKSTTHISDAYKSGDTSQLDDRDKETLAMAKDVIKENIKDSMTQFEKEEAIYQYLTKGMKATTGILTVISDTSNENDNPHDVLKNRSAVCVGYATTFRLFMQMLGIECRVVHNSSLSHSWDLVKLDDGCWYHTDCYMDNESANYRNFNMDDTACRNSGHEWNTGYFEAAVGKKYNYTLMSCKEIKDIYAIPKAVMEAVKDKKQTFSLSFKEKIKSEDEKFAKYMVEQLENMMGSSDKIYTSYQWTINDKGEYVLCYYLTYNSSAADELTQKQRDKIDNRISNVLNQYKFYDTYGNDY